MRCELDANNYCERHKTVHAGRALYWSQSDSAKGEQFRLLWDRQLSNPHSPRTSKAAAAAPRVAIGKPCGQPCGQAATPGEEVWRAGWNFAATMNKWKNSEFALATGEQYEQRRAICKKCPTGKLRQFMFADQCGECKCFVALKAGIIAEPGKSDCPDGHWPIIGASPIVDPHEKPEKQPRFPRPVNRVVHITPRVEMHNPFTGPITRNLLFHVYPLRDNNVWRRHADELTKRLHLFNGRRVVAIVHDGKTDPVEDVQRAYAHIADKFIVLPNDPKLREVATFRPLWDEIDLTDTNAITFYAHAKGVTKPVNPGVSVHRWADIMYEVLLDGVHAVQQALASKHIAGAFQKRGRQFKSSRSTWHYSGAFYWVRNLPLASRRWQHIDSKWWGIEAWPGLQFSLAESVCLFTCEPVEMYSMKNLKEAERLLMKWKEQHAN